VSLRGLFLYLWYLGFFTAQNVPGNIFINGMVYSLFELMGHQIFPRFANRFGTAKVMNAY